MATKCSIHKKDTSQYRTGFWGKWWKMDMQKKMCQEETAEVKAGRLPRPQKEVDLTGATRS